jgi:hypothetical protein
MTYSVPRAVADMNDSEAIESQRQASNAAMADRDVDKFNSFFDTDYIITYGSSAKVLSLEAEIKSIKAMFDDHPEVKFVRTPEDIYVSEAMPLAMESGKWIGGLTLETIYSGRYTAAWRKTEGVWKIHNELFVTLTCEGKNC